MYFYLRSDFHEPPKSRNDYLIGARKGIRVHDSKQQYLHYHYVHTGSHINVYLHVTIDFVSITTNVG
jgi:hypothetical protein